MSHIPIFTTPYYHLIIRSYLKTLRKLRVDPLPFLKRVILRDFPYLCKSNKTVDKSFS